MCASAAWARGDAAAAVRDSLIESATLYGPPERCRERLAVPNKIDGLDLLHIVPYPVGSDDRVTSIRRALSELTPRRPAD